MATSSLCSPLIPIVKEITRICRIEIMEIILLDLC